MEAKKKGNVWAGKGTIGQWKGVVGIGYLWHWCALGPIPSLFPNLYPFSLCWQNGWCRSKETCSVSKALPQSKGTKVLLSWRDSSDCLLTIGDSMCSAGMAESAWGSYLGLGCWFMLESIHTVQPYAWRSNALKGAYTFKSSWKIEGLPPNPE